MCVVCVCVYMHIYIKVIFWKKKKKKVFSFLPFPSVRTIVGSVWGQTSPVTALSVNRKKKVIAALWAVFTEALREPSRSTRSVAADRRC